MKVCNEYLEDLNFRDYLELIKEGTMTKKHLDSIDYFEYTKNYKTTHLPYGPYEKYFKRPFDFISSLLLIIILLPIMAITAFLVKIKLGSPIIFKHARPGLNEEIFYVYKFRSMTNDKDDQGDLLPDVNRLDPFGMKLRATSLDELPELFEILCGKMSVVGPRPLEVYFLPYYTEKEHHRHDVKPGLTGLAQVSGRNNLSWEKKFEFDLEYKNHITFLGDMKIILKTIIKVFKRIDVLEEGGAVIVDFNIEREEKWKAKDAKRNRK